MFNEKVLLLSAPLKERIWGGSYFKDVLKVTDNENPLGEMWSCSAHKEGESLITKGKFIGKTLSEVFNSNRELFNNSTLDEFPILIKLIATSDKLSVQVHPDDEYAKKYENQYGKTEGWLILDTKEDSSIIVGHNAKDKEDLVRYIENDDYDHLLNEIKVKVGEFYPIPSKTIHALGKNLLLLEVQQSSDVTYRFYDYHRKDKEGKERPLHVNKALEVTSFDKYDYQIKNVLKENECLVWKNNYFEVYSQKVDNEFILKNRNKDYLIVSVIEGNIKIDEEELTLGDSFIITSLCENLNIEGNGRIIITKSLI